MKHRFLVSIAGEVFLITLSALSPVTADKTKLAFTGSILLTLLFLYHYPSLMQPLFLISYQIHLIFVIFIAIESFLVWRSGRKYSVSETICSFWNPK